MTRWVILLATLAGLVATAWIVGSIGAAQVLASVLSVGWPGFIAFCLVSVAVLTVLGGAWLAVTPGSPPGQLRHFVWARAVREGATDVLPFAQLGGLVVGGRALAGHGIPDDTIYASMVADLTTEMASQAVLTVAGVAVLAAVVAGADDGGALKLALAGLAATVALLAAFALGQGKAIDLAVKFAARLLPAAAASLGGVRPRLTAIYSDRRAVAASFGLNALAWVMSAAGAWLTLQFMGVDAPLWVVLTIESLIFAVRSVAFVIPGALGVQEAAYLLLAPLFGLDPEALLALSLVKRARDLAVGIPALLIWQLSEGRAIAAARNGAAGED